MTLLNHDLDHLPGRSALLAGALYTLVALALDSVVFGGFVVRPSSVVPIVTGLLLGPAGAWGAAAGAVLTDVARGVFGPFTLCTAVAVGLLGYLPYRLWGGFGPLSTGGTPRMHSGRELAEFGAVTFVASAAAAATLGWGYETLNLFPFYAATGTFVELLVVPLVLGPPLIYLLSPLVVTVNRCSSELVPQLPVYRRRPCPRRIAFVPPLWLFAGAIGSAGYRTFQVLATRGPIYLHNRGLGFLIALDNETVFGAGGSYALIAFSAFMFFVLAMSLVFASDRYVYLRENRINEIDTT